MPFINCPFNDFENRIKNENKKIICYGAGMLPLYTEQLFLRTELLRYVSFYIDGDCKKTGKRLEIASSDIRIESPAILNKMNSKEYVLLIMAEKYHTILERIRRLICIEDWDCYAYPLLNASYFKSMNRNKITIERECFIPRILHYIWFGKSEKNDLHKKCIESWKEKCPDFEIKEWDEDNYDVRKNKYMEQAYDAKKWAYVTDYARLDILYHHGGIYFDTDVEIIKSIELLLHTKAFICFGEWPAPNSGAGIGCIAGNKIIKEMMQTRDETPFFQKDGTFDSYTNSNYEMLILQKYGFFMDFEYQFKHEMALYPPDIVAPISGVGEEAFITDRSIGVHYCNNSWRTANE